jgi:alpha-tubulin suppressor-like RCC1 family protein
MGVLAGVAVPIYLNQRTRAYHAVAVADGKNIAGTITSALLGITDFGTTNGTITVNTGVSPSLIMIALGAGAVIPLPLSQSMSRGSAASGITYANTTQWCLDMANNGQHAFYTQDGESTAITSCGPTPGTSGVTNVSGGLELSYSATNFTIGSDNQQLPATVTGGSGTQTFSLSSGSLPEGVVLDPITGTLTGPAASAWNFRVLQVSESAYTTCAVTETHGVKCWGYNGYGQLGNGTTTNSHIPIGVLGLTSDVQAVSVGTYTACALTTAGGVKCWGYNGNGELGDGTTTNSNIPVDVVGLTSGIQQISVGTYTVCALTISGGAKCWGDNSYGEIGDGTTIERHIPTTVTGLTSSVAQISESHYTACVVMAAGSVKCWGDNSYGQIGDGTTTDRHTPTNVDGLTSGIVQVSAGTNTTCAVNTFGSVKCWGDNSYGQIGDGTTTDRHTPTNVDGLTSDIMQVSAGTNTTCAVDTVGAAKCWGRNTYGELGNGSYISSNLPVGVTGLTSGVNQISTGQSTTCATTTVMGVKCWGYNGTGQVGDGTITNRDIPTATDPQSGFPSSITISVIDSHGATASVSLALTVG